MMTSSDDPLMLKYHLSIQIYYAQHINNYTAAAYRTSPDM